MNKVKTRLLARTLASLLGAGLMVLGFFASPASLPGDVMVFVVGSASVANAATIGGVSTTGSATLNGPTSCSGTNYNTGGTYTQPPAISGDRSYCAGLYACNPNDSASCVNPVTGATMQPNSVCRVGMYSTGTGAPAIRALPLNIIDCARVGYEWRFTQPAGGNRMPNVGTAIDPKTGCWTEYRWDTKSGGIGIPSLMCGATPTVDFSAGDVERGTSGTGWSQTGTGGGTEDRTETSSGGSTGQSTGSIPQSASFSALGKVESAGTKITGWALNFNSISTPVKIRVYINQEFIGEYTANAYRPDIGSQLSQVEGVNNHGFDVAVPSGYGKGDVVNVYAVNSLGGPNPEIGRKEIGSADSPTPSNFFAPYVSAAGGGARTSTTLPVGLSSPAPYRVLTVGEQVAQCKDPSYGFGQQWCPFAPQDGGLTCTIRTQGNLSDANDQTCVERYEACTQHVRGGELYNFCDSVKYAYCREAKVFDAVGRGTLDYNACDRILLEGGCQDDPKNCDMRAILGL